jgi:hypothetical protein
MHLDISNQGRDAGKTGAYGVVPNSSADGWKTGRKGGMKGRLEALATIMPKVLRDGGFRIPGRLPHQKA